MKLTILGTSTTLLKYRLPELQVGYSTAMLGVATVLTLGACALDDPRGDDGDTTEVAERPLSPNPCTQVQMTLPPRHFSSPAFVPMTVNATATCPPGQTPEFHYWVKKWGAPNWTHLESYNPGSDTWIPELEGAWCVTVVARAVGAPEDYQTRASAHCGTITHNCGTSTVAPPTVHDPDTEDAIEAANALIDDDDE